MMVRIRTIAAAIALCVATIAPAVNAQTVAEHQNPSAPSAPAAPVAEPGELDAPPLPAVPDALASRVRDMADIVNETEECFTERGERSEHIADPRCGRWYASLQRGGVAAAHAIGQALVRPSGEEHSIDGGSSEYERGPRLVQVLAATGAPVAVPYMLQHLTASARANRAFPPADEEILRQLVRLSGDDPVPVAPWERGAYAGDDARRRVAAAWVRWWRDHGDDTPAQRAATALSHAQANLTAEDPAVRFAAIQHLASVPAQRAAAASALRDLLSRPDLPARAAVYVRRWARRAHLAIPAPATLAAAM